MRFLVVLLLCSLVLFYSSRAGFCIATPSAAVNNHDDKFLKCIFLHPQDTSNIPLIPVYTQSNASYSTFLIDLINFRNITVNVEDRTAWVQAGATIGEFYYRIAEKSNTLGFAAGFCLTVGAGGHLSGGGLGALVRKYGAAADQIIDAQIANVQGKILNRKTMGKDFFWAIRGGGAASSGVVLSWKVKLLPVSPVVTVAMVE